MAQVIQTVFTAVSLDLSGHLVDRGRNETAGTPRRLVADQDFNDGDG
jgi:hypothetical protein